MNASRPTEHTQPASQALQIVELLERWSIRPETLLSPFDLTEAELLEPEARLRVGTFAAILRRARALTGEPGLGFYLGLQKRISRYGKVVLTAMNAATLREALELACRFTPLLTDSITLRLEVHGQFGDNTPVTDGTIEVYEGDPDGDPYERGEPVMTLQSDSSDDTGHIPPFTLKRGVAYEFKALDAEGKLVGHQYFAPWKRSNRLARFLAPPESILVSTLTTDKVKRGPNHSALVFRSLAGAFRHDLGQSLQIDGKEILADDTAGRENCTVGLFAADQDENGESDLGVSFEAPFVFGTDAFIDAKQPAWIEIDWNGDEIHVPNWPSSEGMISITLK